MNSAPRIVTPITIGKSFVPIEITASWPIPGSPNSVQGAVSDNHGHSVTISAAQLSAANDLVLTLVGGDHPHTVALSGGDDAKQADEEGTQPDTTSRVHLGAPATGWRGRDGRSAPGLFQYPFEMSVGRRP